MANPNEFPLIEGSELISRSWTKLLERDASVKKQFASSEFPPVTSEDVGTPCFREDEQKWYIFTGLTELGEPNWWCPFDTLVAEDIAFSPTENFPETTSTVYEALKFLSEVQVPNSIVLPTESKEYTSDGVTTTYPLQKITSHKETIHVYFSGVKQSPSHYSLNIEGSQVIFDEPPAYGESILIQENATVLEYDLMPIEKTFVADNETTFTMPMEIVNPRVIQVNVDGRILQLDQYVTSGYDVILNEPVTGNVQISTIFKGQLGSPASNSVGTGELKDESVTESKILDEAVTSDKIKDSAIISNKIANYSITSEKLENFSVTTEKLAEESIPVSKLSMETEQRLLGINRVESSMIKDGSITTSKLAEDVLNKISDASAGVTDASNNIRGVVKLATYDEFMNGTAGNKVITAEVLEQILNSL